MKEIRGGSGRGAGPADFEDVEAGAEVAGVGEGLELAEEGGVGIAFHGEEEVAGDGGEPGALGLEGLGTATEGGGGIRGGGEIDVGGDVGFAGSGERIFGGAVFGEGAEGAGDAVGVVVIFGRVAVVGPEEEAVGEGSEEGAEEIGEAGADFGAVAFGEFTGRAAVKLGAGLPTEAAVLSGDEEFSPFAAGAFDDVEGEGVEDFVAESDAGKGRGKIVGGDDEADVSEAGEGFFLGSLEAGEGLGDGVFEGGGGRGGEGEDFAEDVGGEGAVVGSGFDDTPFFRGTGVFPPAEETAGDEAAEEGADADTGVEVAAAAYLAGFAGVVAVVRVVEGEPHEIREGQGAGGGDFFPENTL